MFYNLIFKCVWRSAAGVHWQVCGNMSRAGSSTPPAARAVSAQNAEWSKIAKSIHYLGFPGGPPPEY